MSKQGDANPALSFFSREDVLAFVYQAYARGRIHERETIITFVDQNLLAMPHLASERDWILSQALPRIITGIEPQDELVDPQQYNEWLRGHDKSAWSSWPWLKIYLRERLWRPAKVIDELDRSTDRVLDLLGDPSRQENWDRRGLVVGHVQSGKTQHYTTLVAKALDAGYKVIIVLTGMHENLRQQTQERIDEMITGKNSRRNFESFGIRSFAEKFHGTDRPALGISDISSLTSVAGDYGMAVNRIVNVALCETPVVFVVKKNAKILANVLKKLRGAKAPFNKLGCPALIIDDEADHSSPNSAREDEDPKRINELIRKLLWCCDKASYVGYTATPYANIFMDYEWRDKPDSRAIDSVGSDLFPRAFIISLQAPSNYIGPDFVFGNDGDESVGVPSVYPLPMHIDVDDADVWLPPRHRSDATLVGDMPESLATAIKCFVLSVAARMANGEDTSHCSMLVHVTRFNAVQKQVMEAVRVYVEWFYNELASGAHAEELIDDLRDLWDEEFVSKFAVFRDHPSQKIVPPRLPPWESLEDKLNDALRRLTVALVNRETKEQLDFANAEKEGLVVLAVGGDRLSRGLTLEGLTTSYFLRGAKAYDTLMQMGRWFGYRPGYAHLCRVFAPDTIVDNFKTIILATEELRMEFARMAFLGKPPVEYGLSVREPRGDLLVTALNRMRRGQSVRLHFASHLISSLDINEDTIESNYEAFAAWTKRVYEQHGAPIALDTKGEEDEDGVNRRWENVDGESVVEFLSAYSANQHVCLDQRTASGRSLLCNYIETLLPKGDLTKWTVVVCGSNPKSNKDKRLGSLITISDSLEFRTLGRKRRMSVHDAAIPKFPSRVTFKGVAVGADERLDLSREEAKEAAKLAGAGLKTAAANRAARPSWRGLLLIYPIYPTTTATSSDGTPYQTTEKWTKKYPVIGVALSLPHSVHDKGWDYVCTKQKMNELFGPMAEDLERDDEEEQEGVA
jgi:hypothetical protein